MKCSLKYLMARGVRFFCALVLLTVGLARASQYRGQVTFGGFPVP
jgi:hypothetical protein